MEKEIYKTITYKVDDIFNLLNGVDNIFEKMWKDLTMEQKIRIRNVQLLLGRELLRK